MKLTIITIAILTLIVSTNADSYQNGFITGMIVEKAFPTEKKTTVHKFNKVIIDTNLFEFPPRKNPMCWPIEIKEVDYHKIPFFVNLLYTGVILLLVSTCCRDPEFKDFMFGYILGRFIESLFADDN